MEKTIDELLFEKLRQTRRIGRGKGRGHRGCHRPMMPRGPHPEMMHGMHKRGMLERERVLEIILNGNETGMRQKEILEEVRINPSSLSELIDKLEADRYVERTVDPEDRRATRIVLTEKGRARAYEVMDAHREACAGMFENLSDEEKNQLIVLLDKILIKNEQ